MLLTVLTVQKGRVSSARSDAWDYYETPAGLRKGESYPEGDVLGEGSFGVRPTALHCITAVDSV